MSDDIDIDELAEEAATEGKKTFNLLDRLQKRSYLRETVRVFTDQETGYELGGFEQPAPDRVLFDEARGWGKAKELADLTATNTDGTNDKAIAKVKREMAKLAKKLDETAIDLNLQGVPEIIQRDARRKAKKHLGIKGQVSKDQAEDFMVELDAQVLQCSVVSLHDIASDAKQQGISIEEARNLRDYLPTEEWSRLEAAVAKIQFQLSIADRSTAQVDF